MNLNYLKITMHDNDFTSYYQILGNIVKDLLYYTGYYPEYDFANHTDSIDKILDKDSISKLKPYIEDIWYSVHNSLDVLAGHYNETKRELFKCDMSIVPYLEVENLDWNNSEDIFIPLFSKDMPILLK